MSRIRQMCGTITRRFNPERVVLFGSYADGAPTPDSDVDLLVILAHEGSSVRKAAEIRLALPDDVPIDVIVRSPAKLRERLRRGDQLLSEAVEKGRILYEARR